MSNKPSRPIRPGADRVAAARAQGRSRTTVWLVVGVVMLIGVALVVAVAVSGGSGDSPEQATAAQKATITKQIGSIAPEVFDSVGVGSVSNGPKPIKGEPLTKGGKPEVLFIGAEFCPYCAGERWSVAAALSRFGTFEDLGTTRSASEDVFPNTASLTFHGSSYSSEYIVFTAVEAQSNVKGADGNYTVLDPISPAQQQVWTSVANGSYPFLDIGGRYALSGASYDIGKLADKSAVEISDALTDPSTAIAQGAIGGANAITAAICRLTDGQPGKVCNSAGVKAAQGGLG